MNTQKAEHIMRPISTCLSKDLTLDKVSDHFTKHHIPGAPVIDENHQGIGYISEYDCLKQLMQSTYYCDNTALVKDVMSHTLITTSTDASIMDLAQTFIDNKINVIAVKKETQIVGLISRGDLMNALIKDLESCAVPGQTNRH